MLQAQLNRKQLNHLQTFDGKEEWQFNGLLWNMMCGRCTLKREV